MVCYIILLNPLVIRDYTGWSFFSPILFLRQDGEADEASFRILSQPTQVHQIQKGGHV